ncbi:hypothetical protein VTK26DRAFT_8413 [Humicola hyalothermophila]
MNHIQRKASKNTNSFHHATSPTPAHPLIHRSILKLIKPARASTPSSPLLRFLFKAGKRQKGKSRREEREKRERIERENETRIAIQTTPGIAPHTKKKKNKKKGNQIMLARQNRQRDRGIGRYVSGDMAQVMAAINHQPRQAAQTGRERLIEKEVEAK